MSKVIMSLVLVFFLLIHHMPEYSHSTPDAAEFIRAECEYTLYPALCIDCLSSYSDTIQHSRWEMTHASLTIALSSAESAATFISDLLDTDGLRRKEYVALKQCAENVKDAAYQLRRSTMELEKLHGEADRDRNWLWHVSNMQTWVSSALTDQYTCMDGDFVGGRMKGVIRNSVLDCSQLISNSLALINRFAESR